MINPKINSNQPYSNLHIRTLKKNLSKSELQQEIQPFLMDFPCIGPPNLNSIVLGAWTIYHQKIEESVSS